MSNQAKLWLGVGVVFGLCWLGAAIGILASRSQTQPSPSKGADAQNASNGSSPTKKAREDSSEPDDEVHDFFRNPAAYEEKEVTLTARIFPAEKIRPDALPEERQRPFSGKKVHLFCLAQGEKIDAVAYVPETLEIPEGLFPNDRAVVTFTCGLGKIDHGNQVVKLRRVHAK